MRVLIFSMVLIAIGVQTAFMAFLLGIIGIRSPVGLRDEP
jgi:hypothetical protein